MTPTADITAHPDLASLWAAVDERPGDFVVLGAVADCLEERDHPWAAANEGRVRSGRTPDCAKPHNRN